MKNICLDTHVLIWAIKEEASPGQEAMVPIAKRFLRKLEEDKALIIIPSVVIAELLMSVPPQYHAMTINLFQKGYVVSPFDIQSSAHFARIWRAQEEKKIIAELLNNHQAKRQELKADCMIVATAVAKNAEIIISHDKKLKIFAGDHIPVSEIPRIPEQGSLFPEIL